MSFCCREPQHGFRCSSFFSFQSHQPPNRGAIEKYTPTGGPFLFWRIYRETRRNPPICVLFYCLAGILARFSGPLWYQAVGCATVPSSMYCSKELTSCTLTKLPIWKWGTHQTLMLLRPQVLLLLLLALAWVFLLRVSFSSCSKGKPSDKLPF